MRLILLTIMLSGCSLNPKIAECIDQQVNLYGDLCAEESSGYEDMTPEAAHYQGVKCAVQSAKWCLQDVK